KTQKRPLTGRPSSTLTTNSALEGEKNQKRPVSSESGSGCATPWSATSSQVASTSKRWPARQSPGRVPPGGDAGVHGDAAPVSPCGSSPATVTEGAISGTRSVAP